MLQAAPLKTPAAPPPATFQKALDAAPTPNTSAAVMFSRATIVIHPTILENQEVSVTRPDINFDIEVRSEDALKLEYIHTLNTLTDNTGVMILLNAPVPLPRMQVFTPVDLLYVGVDGVIQMIIPGVVLGNLVQALPTQTPARAILFLKNGTSAARGIKPHDVITGGMFSAAVKVQE